jgi:hypothetical protein
MTNALMRMINAIGSKNEFNCCGSNAQKPIRREVKTTVNLK